MFILSIHYEELGGPWITLTVAAILASATKWKESTEFDKAAVFQKKNHLNTRLKGN